MERSQREISGQLRMGRPTIRKYIRALKDAGLLAGDASDLPEPAELRAAIEKHAPPKAAARQTSSVATWEPAIKKLLERDAKPTAIYQYLRLNDEEFDGSLSAVKRLCRRLTKQEGPRAIDVAIPVDTVAGEVAQVDFGYVGLVFDEVKAVMRKAWIFVMTLGFSRHLFVDIVFDQKVETWCQLHIRAFAFFGGVPRVIVPDNLKAAVIRAAFGIDDDAALNRTYSELARHYGFQIDPAPPRAPKKKGKVERDVRYVKGSFFSTWETQGLSADRRQLTRWNLEVAAVRIHGTTGKRPIDLFEDEEHAALLPLPRQRWERVIWKRATVHTDSHVQVDGAFYSVPWQHIGLKLWVRVCVHSVAIYREDVILCSHARGKRGERKLVEAHLPEHRRDLRERSRSHWEKRASHLGPDVRRLVEAIFGSEDVLLQLRKVQSIITHLEGFPIPRANRAARRALHFGSLSYRAVKSILSKGLDYEPLPSGKVRAWSKGSRFARGPVPLFPDKEIIQ
jgi:transposase